MTASLALKPEYSLDPMAHTVQRLARVVHGQVLTGSTQPVRNVLLALYNSTEHPLDVQTACLQLNQDHFQDLLALLVWFRKTGQEPHQFFIDGPQLMQELRALR